MLKKGCFFLLIGVLFLAGCGMPTTTDLQGESTPTAIATNTASPSLKITIDESNELYGEPGSSNVTAPPTPAATPSQTASPIQTIAPSIPSEETVWINPTGYRYHRSYCQYVKGSSTSLSMSKAKAKGYSACHVCNPGN